MRPFALSQGVDAGQFALRFVCHWHEEFALTYRLDPRRHLAQRSANEEARTLSISAGDVRG